MDFLFGNPPRKIRTKLQVVVSKHFSPPLPLSFWCKIIPILRVEISTFLGNMYSIEAFGLCTPWKIKIWNRKMEVDGSDDFPVQF